jgi:uncharacterized protein (TIGR02246 family)
MLIEGNRDPGFRSSIGRISVLNSFSEHHVGSTMRTPILSIVGSVFAIALVINSCCSSRLTVAESNATDVVVLDSALQHYANFVLHMQSDSIADLFLQDGEVVNPGEEPLKGRETIRDFLKSFTEYKVIAESMHADSTHINGTNATQVGHYYQKVTVPSGKTIEVSGHFKIEWKKDQGTWLIRLERTTNNH